MGFMCGLQEATADAFESGAKFPPYISVVDVSRGLQSGKYVQGKFHLSRDNCLEANVAVHGSDEQVHIHLLLIDIN